MAFKFPFKGSDIDKRLEKMKGRIEVAMKAYLLLKAQGIEAKMKSNRPWTDRSGNAKNGLQCVVSIPEPSLLRVTLAHGSTIDYGIWLELAKEKKYAIVGPTFRTEAPRLIEGMQGLMTEIAK